MKAYLPIVIPLAAAAIGVSIGELVAWLGRRQRLRYQVFSNLDSAYENGYFEPGEYLHNIEPRGLVCDLQAHADDMAEHRATKLEPHVRAWLHMKGL